MPYNRVARGIVSCDDLLAGGSESGSVAVTRLAPVVPYERMPPAFLDTRPMAPTADALLLEHLAWTGEPGKAIELFTLPGASVFGQGSVMLRDGGLLRDAALEFLSHGRAPDGCEIRGDGFAIRAAQYRRLRGRTLLVKRPWYRNFGHWLVDLLPLLPLAARAGVQVDTILFGDVAAGPIRAMVDAVAERCFPGVPAVFSDDDTLWDLDALLYVRPVHVPPLFKHPTAIAEARNYALGTLAGKPGGTRRRLFIDRSHIPGRDIANMAELQPVLDRFGLQPIRPDRVDFPEQVAQFRDAELVVGAKGAAFATAMVCAPGTAALLLSPDGFWDPFFWDLLTPLDIRYGEIFGRTLPEGFRGVSLCRFSVEPAALEAGLRGLGISER